MAFEEAVLPLLRLIEDGFNAGNLDLLREFVADDVVDHAPVAWEPDGPTPGLDAMRRRIGVMRRMFPDARMAVDDLLQEGDRLAWRWTLVGTHTGEALGMAPSGRRVEVHGISMARIRDGRIVEHWVYSDASSAGS